MKAYPYLSPRISMNEVDTRICSNRSPSCIHMICIYFLNSTCLQNLCIWVSIHGCICHWTLTPDYVKQLITLFRVSPLDICIVRATIYLRLHTYNSCRKKGSYLEPNYSSLKEPLPLGEWLQTLRQEEPSSQCRTVIFKTFISICNLNEAFKKEWTCRYCEDLDQCIESRN